MKLIEKRQTEIDELYFETFGQAVASPLTANTNFATEKRLTDEEILSKAKGSKNAFLFAGLWEGQWQEIYPSQSEADSALCMILAFWTMKNAEQIVVVNEGEIAGVGTHKELMKSCETYREIAMSQLSEKELAQ